MTAAVVADSTVKKRAQVSVEISSLEVIETRRDIIQFMLLLLLKRSRRSRHIPLMRLVEAVISILLYCT